MALSMGQAAGSPYVTLTKTGTDGEFTVTRTVAGVVTPVRGVLTVTAGTGVLVDREAPQATSVTYNAGADSTAGVTNSVGAWLIHPGQQSLDMAVMISEYPEWTREVRTDAVVPLGSRNPVIVTDKRQGRTGARFVLVVRDLAEQVKLENLLNSTRVVLLSTNHYQSGAMWVVVGPESWRGVNPAKSTPYWLVTVSLTEVDRPSVTTSGVVTWLDVGNRYTVWTPDLSGAYPTWDALIADSENWTT